MAAHHASRTLLKSAPELWAECSDAAALSRHLTAFGEIRITRRHDETAVAWEGDAASGTVSLESSAWGTRVTLTAITAEPATAVGLGLSIAPEVALALATAERAARYGSTPAIAERDVAERAVAATPHSDSVVESAAPVKRRRRRPIARLRAALRRWRSRAAPEPGATGMNATPTTAPMAPEPTRRRARRPAPEEPATLALTAALDSLGRAHHRPYSRP